MSNQKRVDEIKDLNGWRVPSNEELKIGQGLLLANLKSRHKTSFIVGVMIIGIEMVLILFFFPDVFTSLFQNLYNTDIEGVAYDIFALIFWGYVGYQGGKELFGNIFDNYYKRLRNVIINGEIKVNDIEVVQLDSRTGYDGSIQDYWAKIQDIEGNLCKKTVYVLSAEKSIEKGRALLIYAESKGDTKEIVIPYKEKSPKTWEAGLHLYKKNVK